MEKRKPSFDLAAFKAVCGDPERLRMTLTAEQSAEQLGYEPVDVAALVRTMERRMFFKSMTSFSNHRRWQDVYHVPGRGGVSIYLKFTDDIVTEFMVLSFKER